MKFFFFVISYIDGATFSHDINMPPTTPITSHNVDMPSEKAIPLTPSNVHAEELLAE